MDVADMQWENIIPDQENSFVRSGSEAEGGEEEEGENAAPDNNREEFTGEAADDNNDDAAGNSFSKTLKRFRIQICKF